MAHAWTSLPLHEDAVTNAFFATSICCEVGIGSSTLFWLDAWFNGCRLLDLAPELFDVVAQRVRKRTMVAALANETWIRDILGPLTIPVIGQYLHLWHQLQEVQLEPVEDDWIF
jgi:hypothetical protein